MSPDPPRAGPSRQPRPRSLVPRRVIPDGPSTSRPGPTPAAARLAATQSRPASGLAAESVRWRCLVNQSQKWEVHWARPPCGDEGEDGPSGAVVGPVRRADDYWPRPRANSGHCSVTVGKVSQALSNHQRPVCVRQRGRSAAAPSECGVITGQSSPVPGPVWAGGCFRERRAWVRDPPGHGRCAQRPKR